MTKISSFVKLVRHNTGAILPAVFYNLNNIGLFRWLPDKLFLSFAYRICTGKIMNWKKPELFTEKIQWLKLYQRNEDYTRMVDKVAAKEYVREKIGGKYIIPTLGVWSSFDEIDFDSLPDRFVLKTNNGSGSNSVIICKNKETFDKREARIKLNNSLYKNTYYDLREWPYKNIKPCIFAEKYLEENNDKSISLEYLTDYKFFCFGGDPMYCQVIKGRSNNETIEFYDKNWVKQPFIGLNPLANPSELKAKQPLRYDEMLNIASILAKELPFVRIDLYECNSNVYFGEITLYPASGLGHFNPDKYDSVLGNLISLPS